MEMQTQIPETYASINNNNKLKLKLKVHDSCHVALLFQVED